MIRLALGELRARPARPLATLLSVALGVGFVTGSLVLVDSVRAAFDDRYVDGGRGAAGVVRPAGGLRTQRYARVPGRVAAAVAAAPGVAAVAPVHRETVLLARPDGERLEPRGGGSRLDRAGLYLGNWIADPHLRDQTLRAGRPPATAAEAAIHRHTAAAYGLGVGDRVRLVLPAAAFQATITGVFDYGDADPAPNAPLFTPGVLVTTEAAAARLGDPVELRVSAAPGVSAERLRGAVAAAVGDRDYEIVPAETAARDTFELIWRMNLGPLATGMSVFAGITVLAAGLIVYTTFAVTVAQRTRRYALLRLIGAGRGQVAVIGARRGARDRAGGGVAGTLLGYGVAEGPRLLFAAAWGGPRARAGRPDRAEPAQRADRPGHRAWPRPGSPRSRPRRAPGGCRRCGRCARPTGRRGPPPGGGRPWPGSPCSPPGRRRSRWRCSAAGRPARPTRAGWRRRPRARSPSSPGWRCWRRAAPGRRRG